MQTRYRAAAASSVLLLTATAGLAASGGAAEASGTHHTSGRALAHLTVTIKSSGKGVFLSTNTIRRGRTTFSVYRNAHGGGLIEVLRLKKGYSLARAQKDFGAAFGPTTNVRAVRRIDKNVVFYGGMPVPAKGVTKPNKWAVDIDHRGKYYVLNLDKNLMTSFRAKGTEQRRSWPQATGKLNIADGNIWKPGANNLHKGWMNTTNNAREPHFVVMQHVKDGTTAADVLAAFTGGPDPSAADHASADTGVISPGHTFRWAYSVPRGHYASMCFWPSKVDGTPHAFMGMVAVFDLS